MAFDHMTDYRWHSTLWRLEPSGQPNLWTMSVPVDDRTADLIIGQVRKCGPRTYTVILLDGMTPVSANNLDRAGQWLYDHYRNYTDGRKLPTGFRYSDGRKNR
jgi:hypothetical protein